MNILAIDTSSSYCSAALFIGNNQPLSLTRHIPRKHNEEILPIIDKLVRQAGIKKQEINLLAYGLGPGSFVGVRLAAAAIHAMAAILDCPVVGFSSMHAIAMEAYYRFKAETITVILDARISDIYLGQYTWHKDLQIMGINKEKCLKVTSFDQEVDKKNLGFVIGDVVKGIRVELNAVDYCPDTRLLLPIIQCNYQEIERNNMLTSIVQPTYLQCTSHSR